VVYEPILLLELGALAPENIPKQIVTSLNTAIKRHQSFLSLSPIVQDEYGFKVKSFSYRINTTTAKTSQSNKVANTISNSVLATGEWYRFYIEKIWRL
jgi:hypothetical protein